MHTNAEQGAAFLASELESLDDVDRVYDVGGGTGAYATGLLETQPGIEEAVVADLPYVVEQVTPRYVERSGAADRVRTEALDYTEDGFAGGNDLVLMNTLLHQHQPAFIRELFEKARRWLEEGGRLVTSTFFTDEGGAAPERSALFGLEVLALLPNGHLYSLTENKRLLPAAGFEVQAVFKSPGGADYIVAGA